MSEPCHMLYWKVKSLYFYSIVIHLESILTDFFVIGNSIEMFPSNSTFSTLIKICHYILVQLK